MHFIESFLIRSKTLSLVNIPNKTYWTAPENIIEALRRVKHLFSGVLVFVNTILLSILLMIRLEVKGDLANGIFALIFSIVIYFIFWTYRLFSIPKAN